MNVEKTATAASKSYERAVCRFGLCLAFFCILVGLFAAVVFRSHYVSTKLEKALSTNHPDFTVPPAGKGDRLDEQLVILFGDSRIQQWSPLPSFGNLRFLLRGVGGDTSGEMVARFGREVLDRDPGTILIQAGINDLVAASLDRTVSKLIMERLKLNLAMMTDAAVNRGASVLLMTIVRPAQPSWLRRVFYSPDIYVYVDEINAYIRILGAKQGVIVIDADAILTSRSYTLNRKYAADFLHWRRAAYLKLNLALQEYWSTHALQ